MRLRTVIHLNIRCTPNTNLNPVTLLKIHKREIRLRTVIHLNIWCTPNTNLNPVTLLKNS